MDAGTEEGVPGDGLAAFAGGGAGSSDRLAGDGGGAESALGGAVPAAVLMGAAAGGASTAARLRGSGELLVLASACPGWVCYAEKTAPEALPCMSTVKSSQQVLVGRSRVFAS